MALTDKLTAIANAIRAKTGKTESLTLEQMPTEIEGIESDSWNLVRFFGDDGALLGCDKVVTGGNAVYDGDTPVSSKGNATDYPFEGWEPSPTNIQGDTDCYAQFGGDVSFDTTDFALGYGVEWDYTQSSPVLTRIGLSSGFSDPAPATSLTVAGSSPFDNVMPWSGMKRYNIIDGAIAYSEDDAGFSMTDYDTVVYIPKFYYAAYKDTANSKWRWSISPTKKEGYAMHPGSGRYIGRYHNSGDSSAVFSKSGAQPLVNTTRANFRTYSHKKGENWWMIDMATWSALQLLFMVEFANFDSQTILGKGGCYNLALGQSDAAAYHTCTGAPNQYRWIEYPCNRVSTTVDGVTIYNRVPYIGTNNSTFADSTANLESSDVTLPKVSGNFISGFGYSSKFPWAFLPDAATGSETTYVTDSVGATDSTETCKLEVGGCWYSDGYYGMFYCSSANKTSASSAFAGSRLIYIP